MRRDQSTRLVIAPQPCTFRLLDGLSINGDAFKLVIRQAGVFSRFPLIETRPSSISRSTSRREPMPARASAFAIRSGAGSAALFLSLSCVMAATISRPVLLGNQGSHLTARLQLFIFAS